MKDNKEFIRKLNETPIKRDKTDKLIDVMIIFSLVVIALCLIFGTFICNL
jgi:hypothetical protein